jgi:ubiquinone/menaquinone biosynthesis C-methylase UbiE
VFIDRALRQLRKAIPELAGMKAGKKVLDVCCGTGDQAIRYAQRGLDTQGIDLDPKMISVALSKKKKYGKDNLDFQVADATDLPFEDSAFDYATVSLALHEKPWEVQQKVIAEMRRVTRKGGALVLADFGVPAGRFIRLVEGLVGGEHYACFKTYQTNGGLEKLADSTKLNIEKRDAVMGGAVRLFLIRN